MKYKILLLVLLILNFFKYTTAFDANWQPSQDDLEKFIKELEKNDPDLLKKIEEAEKYLRDLEKNDPEAFKELERQSEAALKDMGVLPKDFERPAQQQQPQKQPDLIQKTQASEKPKSPINLDQHKITSPIISAHGDIANIIDCIQKSLRNISRKAQTNNKIALKLSRYSKELGDILYFLPIIKQEQHIIRLTTEEFSSLYNKLKDFSKKICPLDQTLLVNDEFISSNITAYDILGINQKASTQDIKKAYLRKINSLNLDNNNNTKILKKELDSAYNTLKDTKLRSRLDKEILLEEEENSKTSIISDRILNDIVKELTNILYNRKLLEEIKKVLELYEPEALKRRQYAEELAKSELARVAELKKKPNLPSPMGPRAPQTRYSPVTPPREAFLDRPGYFYGPQDSSFSRDNLQDSKFNLESSKNNTGDNTGKTDKTDKLDSAQDKDKSKDKDKKTGTKKKKSIDSTADQIIYNLISQISTELRTRQAGFDKLAPDIKNLSINTKIDLESDAKKLLTTLNLDTINNKLDELIKELQDTGVFDDLENKQEIKKVESYKTYWKNSILTGNMYMRQQLQKIFNILENIDQHTDSTDKLSFQINDFSEKIDSISQKFKFNRSDRSIKREMSTSVTKKAKPELKKSKAEAQQESKISDTLESPEIILPEDILKNINTDFLNLQQNINLLKLEPDINIQAIRQLILDNKLDNNLNKLLNYLKLKELDPEAKTYYIQELNKKYIQKIINILINTGDIDINKYTENKHIISALKQKAQKIVNKYNAILDFLENKS